MIRTLCAAAIALISLSAPAPAIESIRGDQLQDRLNTILKARKSGYSVTDGGCKDADKSDCTYYLSHKDFSPVRVKTNGTTDDAMISEISMYLPDDGLSIGQAATLTVYIAELLTPSSRPAERQQAARKLVQEFRGPGWISEARIRDVSYTLRGRRGEHIAIYASSR